jgi:hypothetical protein
LKTTYTEEAIADIVEAITYLNERNPTAAANLDANPAVHRPFGRSTVRRPDLAAGPKLCRAWRFSDQLKPARMVCVLEGTGFFGPLRQ